MSLDLGPEGCAKPARGCLAALRPLLVRLASQLAGDMSSVVSSRSPEQGRHRDTSHGLEEGALQASLTTCDVGREGSSGKEWSEAGGEEGSAGGLAGPARGRLRPGWGPGAAGCGPGAAGVVTMSALGCRYGSP